jgi:hypothetical protein
MSEPVPLLLLEFLAWIADRRRTYADAMEAWRSSCPRHTVWEDALADGLIRFQGDGAVRDYEVVLTPRGETVLSVHRPPDATPRSGRP